MDRTCMRTMMLLSDWVRRLVGGEWLNVFIGIYSPIKK